MHSSDFTQHQASKFHDAELVRLEHQRAASSLILDFELIDGGIARVEFLGVCVFRITDVVRQNVVSRVLSSSWYPFTDSELKAKVQWVNSLVDAPISLARTFLDKYLLNIRSGQWKLFLVEPSCGAEVVVICDSISFLSEND